MTIKFIFYTIVAFTTAFVVQRLLHNGPSTLKPENLRSNYDYIIVGAGSAGCVLASRISEDATKTVLLLEAGGEETEVFYSHVAGAATYMCGSKIDWQYMTEPQRYCCDGLVNGQHKVPRGKVLGGTSVLNWMCYVRGHPADYDRWAELGNPGWSYNDVLPYFNMAQTVRADKYKNSPNHGHDGPINTVQPEWSGPGKDFLAGAVEMGYRELEDTTGRETGGFGLANFFTYKGIRQSTVKQYLRPAMSRKNLDVVSNAHVTRILFEHSAGKKPRTSGVEYKLDGKMYQISAKKEVILSAGAIASPQILMLSGVGPADHLKEHNIPVVFDSPAVGQNLDDHLAIYLVYSLNVTDATDYENLFTLSKLIKAIPQYMLYGSGPFSTTALEMLGYFHTGLTTKHAGPDMQIYVNKGHGINPPEETLNYKRETFEAASGRVPRNMSTILFQPTLLHLHNTGDIRLRSNDPFDYPIIDPNFFDNDKDAKILAKGARIVLDIMKSKAMAKYSPKLMESPMPGCDHTSFLSDEYLECIANKRAFALYHPVSTCRMGPEGQNSVVDHALKVHGVTNLRIVDASVFPEQVSANTNAVVIMVAEKAAAIISNDS